MILVNLGEIVKDQGYQEAVRAGGLLRHVERTLVLRLGFVIACLGFVGVGEIAHKQGDTLIGSALRLGRDIERLLVEFLCLTGIGLQQIHGGQVGEGLGQARIARREILLHRAEYLLEHPGCFAIPTQRLVGAGQIVQGRDVGKVVRAAALGGCLGFLGLCKRGGIITGRVQLLKTLLRRRHVDLLRRGLQQQTVRGHNEYDNRGGQSASPCRSHDPLQGLETGCIAQCRHAIVLVACPASV